MVIAHGTAVADASSPRDVAGLLRRVEAVLAERRAAGAGLALLGPGGLAWAGGVGLADVAAGTPVTADTAFRAASLSKSITALAVMRLVEEGRLSLEDRLRDLAPEVPFENPWEAEQPVRVGHLLEHTAGFDFLRYNEWFEDRPEPRSLLEALALNPRSRRARWAPGSRVSYSNEGYLVAGYLVEKASGRSFDDAAQALVFAPLGMDGSAFRLGPALRGRLAQGYRAPGRPAAYQEDLMRPAAGALVTPRDMLRYLRFWVGRGAVDGRQVLSRAGIERIESRRTLRTEAPEAQYGLGNGCAQLDGFAVRGHGGVTFGFVTVFGYLPREGVGWAVLLNSEDPGARDAVERELVSFLTAGLARPAPQPPGPGPAGLAGLDGFYRDVTPGEELSAPWARLGGVEVVRHGEALAVREVRVTGPRSLFTRSDVEPLVPAGVDAFRRPAEVLSSLTFLRGPDGRAQAVVTPGALLERAPGGLLALERALLGAALVLSVAGAALAPAVLLLSSRAGGWGWGLAALASLPGACLAALWVVFHRWPDRLGAFGAASAAVTILGWAFAASALALLAAAALAPREVGLTARAHALLVGAAGMGLALFAAQAGWIGLRTWRW